MSIRLLALLIFFSAHINAMRFFRRSFNLLGEDNFSVLIAKAGELDKKMHRLEQRINRRQGGKSKLSIEALQSLCILLNQRLEVAKELKQNPDRLQIKFNRYRKKYFIFFIKQIHSNNSLSELEKLEQIIPLNEQILSLISKKHPEYNKQALCIGTLKEYRKTLLSRKSCLTTISPLETKSNQALPDITELFLQYVMLRNSYKKGDPEFEKYTKKAEYYCTQIKIKKLKETLIELREEKEEDKNLEEQKQIIQEILTHTNSKTPEYQEYQKELESIHQDIEGQQFLQTTIIIPSIEDDWYLLEVEK